MSLKIIPTKLSKFIKLYMAKEQLLPNKAHKRRSIRLVLNKKTRETLFLSQTVRQSRNKHETIFELNALNLED